MAQMKEKVLRFINKAIEDFGFEAIDVPVYSNAGRVSIQYRNEIGELGSVSYDIQPTTLKFSITINGKPVLSQPPREGYFDFFMEYAAANDFKNFIQALEQELFRLTRTMKTRK